MNVYEPLTEMGPDGNCTHCRFDVVTSEARRMLNEGFCGEPFALECWAPLQIVRSPSTPGNLARPLGDRAGVDFAFDPMVLSLRAREVLLPHVGAFGQFLPLDFVEAEYSLFNVTHFVDALDLEKSEVAYFADGGIKRVKRYAFKRDAVRDQWIFKIPQQPRGFVFVTDRFVQVAREAGLTGFDFVPQWSDEPAAQAA